MDLNTVMRKLEDIERNVIGLKAILNVGELSQYKGFSKSHIYKLVHMSKIPYSKPNGKMLFFERKKIDEWILSKSYMSAEEIRQKAIKAYKR